MISLRAAIAKSILICSHQKRTPTLERVEAKNSNQKKELLELGEFYKKSKITRTHLCGIPVLIIDPLKKTNRITIYLHGGGFVYGLSKIHLNYAELLARRTESRVILIDYSLSPESKFPIAINQIEAIWKYLINKGCDSSKITIAGDSAGASLAISSVLLFNQNQLPNPACLVLFSPAVDLTLNGKSYDTNERSDIILSKDIMRFFVDSYAGITLKNNPLVSPLFADLTELPPVFLQFSSNEIMSSECIAFANKLKDSGVDVELLVGDNLWHNWHLANNLVPESRQSIKAVVKYLISKTSI